MKEENRLELKCIWQTIDGNRGTMKEENNWKMTFISSALKMVLDFK